MRRAEHCERISAMNPDNTLRAAEVDQIHGLMMGDKTPLDTMDAPLLDRDLAAASPAPPPVMSNQMCRSTRLGDDAMESLEAKNSEAAWTLFRTNQQQHQFVASRFSNSPWGYAPQIATRQDNIQIRGSLTRQPIAVASTLASASTSPSPSALPCPSQHQSSIRGPAAGDVSAVWRFDGWQGQKSNHPTNTWLKAAAMASRVAFGPPETA